MFRTPVGVGFSYADNQSYVTNDDIAADDNCRFVKVCWDTHSFLEDCLHICKGFFKKFPQLMNNTSWISGESYAGIHVPILAVREAQDSSVNVNSMSATGFWFAVVWFELHTNKTTCV